MENIERRKLSEQVFEVLKDRILEGKYAPNEKLPSENAFAQEFGVSRLTIRAAIARLCALGYVDVRNGDGSFVRETHVSLKELYPTIVGSITLKDVNDFRRLLETECAKQLTAHVTDQDLSQLRECNQKFVQFFEDLEEFDTEKKQQLADLDYSFHLLICKLSGNPMYYMVYESAGEIIKEHMFVNLSSRWIFNRADHKSEASRKTFVEGHSDIIDAIASGDISKVKSVVRMHADYTVYQGK